VTRSFDLPGRSAVHAVNAMAATSHPLATATALTVLREGGNAVDAAIAASATLCVVEPHMTGIGGDCFVILAEPDGSVHGLNGSGRSAKAASLDYFLDRKISRIESTSPHSVTVPGAVKAWEALHMRFGSMDWARLFSDAVDHAASGFPVAPRVAHDWAKQIDKLNGNRGAAKHLLFDEKTPATGDRITLAALGKTLERIAREGASAFYEGTIAEEIAATVQALGGLLSEDDLAACEADWVNLISTQFCGQDIFEIPPNGQGITALIMLNLLSATGSNHSAGSAEYFHELIELGRIAYAMRDVHVTDADHMKKKVSDILSTDTTATLLKQFDPCSRNQTLVLPDLPTSNTVYLSVVDRDGRAVSFINSVYSGFGSGIVTEQSGVALQDRGSWFSLQPGHPNVIAGSKRTLHTIIPAMAMKDGKPSICFGVMGGSFQPMGQAQVLVNMLQYGMDPQEALDVPRIFWDNEGSLLAEAGISDETFAKLQQMGHPMVRGGIHGGGQIIRMDHDAGTLVGGSDPRKDGHAAGY